MTKGTLTREQAIEIVGEDAVNCVESDNCEPTNRVGYNGACQDDALTEWRASKDATDMDGEDVVLSVYYYTTHEDDQRMADADGDGSAIDWDIAGYEVE